VTLLKEGMDTYTPTDKLTKLTGTGDSLEHALSQGVRGRRRYGRSGRKSHHEPGSGKPYLTKSIANQPDANLDGLERRCQRAAHGLVTRHRAGIQAVAVALVDSRNHGTLTFDQVVAIKCRKTGGGIKDAA
jgi:hypothetical protein